MRGRLAIAALAVSALGVSVAHAQVTVEGERITSASCVSRAPAPGGGGSSGTEPPPVTWSDFEITGELSDPAPTMRAVFEPTMQRHRALTDTARADIERMATSFGYHVVSLRTRQAPKGTVAVIHLSPLPMVRWIEVDIDVSIWKVLSSPILDDEITRRMRVRAGSYLAWAPVDRGCELHEEKRRIEEFLRDEGYYQGRVSIAETRTGRAVVLDVEVRLGPGYETGVVNVADREPNNVSDEEIRKIFRHKDCIVSIACLGDARFTRDQHQKDIVSVVELFHQRGYPAVRVRTDYDAQTSFDRRTKRVNFNVIVDQRRQLEVVFEGHDPAAIPDQALRQQLTFNAAASSDDVEAHASARAVTSYLQGRGYFDARVTWIRERFERFDRIIYRIEQGKTRQVQSIAFVGNRAIGTEALLDTIATRTAGGFSSSLFGASSATTSAQLAADVERIVEAYRRAGYRDTRVEVSAATVRTAIGSAALTGALAAADRGEGLHVRFTIREGLPTLLTQIQVDLGGGKGEAIVTDEQRDLCALVLGELAAFYDERQLASPAAPDRCVATAANLKFREANATETRDRLKDRLFSKGRPRATVAYETRVLGPHRVAARYTLGDVQALRIGKVVIRGNFRTRSSIIAGELQLAEGGLLTKDALAEGARRLRGTGLFDAVNVAMPDLDNISEGEVNAIVEVAERYDYVTQIDTEGGYSSFNGAFVKLIPTFKNLWGRGISLDLAGTIGFSPSKLVNDGELVLRQLSAETTLRVPQFLARQWTGLEVQTELTAFRRLQDTPRFGEITTDGVTLAFSHTRQWPRTETRGAHAVTVGPHYDFRRRERLVDVLRPSGADDAETQVPISTRTGLVGVVAEWEHRIDRFGNLSPLAPEGGFRLWGQAAYAAGFLGGQATFVKLSGAATKYWSVGSNLILRADLRYDHGIPLGGAVLLPEVERFFAGGDTTVRGYEDDRLKTQVIEVAVPPLDNVKQIRVLPAGGNIRAMGSIDAQVRVWKVLATAVFVDAGLITNQWATVTEDDIRPSVGVALLRIVTPFGTGALERAMPLRPQLGDDPRGRWHLSFAARAQF